MAQLKDTTITGSLRATNSIASSIGQFDIIYAKEETSTGITENYTSGADKKILQSGTFNDEKITYWAPLSPTIDLTNGTSNNGPKLGATIAGDSTLVNNRTELNKATVQIYGVTKLTSDYDEDNLTLATNGRALQKALQTLDSNIPNDTNVNIDNPAVNKTLMSLSIADGKISAATFTNIAIDLSQITSGINNNAILYGDSTGTIGSIAPEWKSWVAGSTNGPQAKIQIGNIDYTSAAIPSAGTNASGIVTTGNQSFLGVKTFASTSGNLVIKKTDVNATDSERGEAKFSSLQFGDVNNKVTGEIGLAYQTDGGHNIRLKLYNYNTSGTQTGATNVLSATMDNAGNISYAVADAPAFRTAINAVNKGGDTMTGALNIGEKLRLWTDSEGGNIRITSADGNHVYEIDAQPNTSLRVYTKKPDGTTNIFLTWSNEGVLSATRFYGPLTGNVTGNVTGNASTATGVQDAGDTSKTLTIRYSGSGVSATDWIPMYDSNGNLVPVTSTNLANKVRDKASGSWGINITGNAATATTLLHKRNDFTKGNIPSSGVYYLGNFSVDSTGTGASAPTTARLGGIEGRVAADTGDNEMRLMVYKNEAASTTTNIFAVGLKKDGTAYASVGGTFSCATLNPSNALAVNKGGTGATDAPTARTNLGITPANIGAVSKSGDSMTGTLTFNNVANAIAYTGTKATFNMIKFIDNTSDAYGNGISIGGGGSVIIGAGESADSIMTGISTITGGTENTYIGADGVIYFYPGVNANNTSETWDESKKISMSAAKINIGEKVSIWTDTEGGNIRIVSRDGEHNYEIDGYNNTSLRLWTKQPDGTNNIFLGWSNEGILYCQSSNTKSISISSLVIDSTINPSSDIYLDSVEVKDKNSKRFGLIRHWRHHDDGTGTSGVTIQAVYDGVSPAKSNGIEIKVDNNGTQSYWVANQAAFRTAISALATSGGTVTGTITSTAGTGMIIKPASGTRAYLNIIPQGDNAADINFGRSNTNKWALSSRASSEAFFGLYNHTKANWAIKVMESDNAVTFIGAVSAVIQHTGISSNWEKGRDNAIVRTTSLNGYSVLASTKTSNGSWEIGAYNNSSYTDDLVFTYVTDTIYNGTAHTYSSQIKFSDDGTVTTNGLTVGNKISLVSDGEGGNIRLTSKDGSHTYEIDSYENTYLRLYTSNAANDGYVFLTWTNEGVLSCNTLSPINALAINKGGTGATSASAARNNLGIYSGVVTFSNVGTGSTWQEWTNNSKVTANSIIVTSTNANLTSGMSGTAAGKFHIGVNNYTGSTISSVKVSYIIII